MMGRVRRGHPVLARVGDLVLTLLAIGGTVCAVLVPLAFFFDISLILFKSGSMGPTIPVGSLAVVRQIPASEVNVGDIVTVDRTPLPPITHRVVQIEPGDGPTRLLTLRGDANDANDATPYAVTHVRLVLWSVPKLGYAVRAVSNPYVTTAITIGTAALVTWAFWPRAAEPTRRRTTWYRQRVDSPRPGPVPPGGTPSDRTATRAESTARRMFVLLAVLLPGAAATLVPANPARAAQTEDVIRSRYLTLVSIEDPRMAAMPPGVPVPWQVGVSARANHPGTVTITLSALGPLVVAPDGLQVMVAICPTRWVRDNCPSGQGEQVLANGPARRLAGQPVTIGSMRSDEQRWVLVTASLLANSTASGAADLTLTATGFGDKTSTGGKGGTLPRTGADLRTPVIAGAGALLVGLVLVLAARRRRIRREQS